MFLTFVLFYLCVCTVYRLYLDSETSSEYCEPLTQELFLFVVHWLKTITEKDLTRQYELMAMSRYWRWSARKMWSG